MDAEQATDAPPPDARQHLEAAYASLREDEHDRALSLCRAALELAPCWAEAHNLRGLVLDELGRLRDAAEAYHAALEIDPQYEDAQDNLLWVLNEIMTGELDVLTDLEEVDLEELARDHLLWTYDLLDEEVDEGVDLDLALWECDLVLSLSPGMAEAHNLRGTVLDELGRPEEARQAFQAALQLDPDFRAARDNLQEMEMAAQGPTAPVVRCPICGAENPPAAGSCRQCGFGFVAADSFDRPAGTGEEPVVAAVAPTPAADALADEDDRLTEADRHLDLAYEYNEQGEFDEALDECDRALAADPGLAEAHNLRGIVLEALCRPHESVKAYRTAVDLDPRFTDARENLRELEAELRQMDPVVTVTTFLNPLQAQAARIALEEQGIRCFIADERVPAGGVRLMAQESDLPRIVQALGLPTDDEGLRCPACGSWDVDVSLLGRKRRCQSCGHEWRTEVP